MPPRGYCQTLLRTRSLRRKTSWFMRPYFTSLCIREYFRPLRAGQEERQREWKRTRGEGGRSEGGRGHKIGKGEGISRRTSARNFILRAYWSAYGEEDVRGLRSKPRSPFLSLSLSLLLPPLLLSFLLFSVLVRDPRGRGQVRFNFGERDRPLRFLPMVPNWKKCARRCGESSLGERFTRVFRLLVEFSRKIYPKSVSRSYKYLVFEKQG